MNYFAKMKGAGKSPPRVELSEIVWSWVGAFFGIGAVALINFNFLGGSDLVMIIGSFGASAVLVYGAIKSPLAQPRNLIGGHLLSAVVGVVAYKIFEVVGLKHLPVAGIVINRTYQPVARKIIFGRKIPVFERNRQFGIAGIQAEDFWYRACGFISSQVT